MPTPFFWKMRLGPRVDPSDLDAAVDWTQFTLGSAFPGGLAAQFTTVNSVNGRLDYSEELTDAWQARTFTLSVTGYLAPRNYIHTNRVVVIEKASTPAGTYTVWLVGFIQSARLIDDGDKTARWEAQVVSSAQLLSQQYAKPTRYGEVNIAIDAETAASVPLAGAWKDRYTGDFTAAEPPVDAVYAVDGEMSTGFIGDTLLGPSQSNSTGHNGLLAIFANPHDDAPPGVRYIEFHNDTMANGRVLLVWDTEVDGGQQATIAGIDDFNTFNDESFVFAESTDAFGRYFPTAQPDHFYGADVSDEQATREFFQSIRPAVGQLVLRTGSTDTNDLVLTWGDWAGYVADAQSRSVTFDDWVFTGATNDFPAGLPKGQVLYYAQTASPSPAYQALNLLQPGLVPFNNLTDRSTQPWLALKLPGPGMRLRDDISSAPGDGRIYTVDATGRGTTEGILSGVWLSIGGAFYHVASKTATYFVIDNSSGTGIWSHKAGDAVRIRIDHPLNSGEYYITDAYPITAVRLERRDANTVPYLYRLRLSELDARLPSDSRHEDDYVTSQTRTDNMVQRTDGTWYDNIVVNPSRYIDTALIEFGAMQDVNSLGIDYMRPKIDEVIVTIDPAALASTVVVTSPETKVGFIAELLKQATSMPAGAVLEGSSSVGMVPTVTDYDDAWAVVTDLADYLNCFLSMGRDSKITVGEDAFAGGTSYTPSDSWGQTDIRQVRVERQEVFPVTQVELPYVLPDGTRGVVRYPSTPTHDGNKVTLPETLYATAVAATAACTRAYRRARFPYGIYVETVQGDEAVRAGQIHSVTWTWRDTTTSTWSMVVENVDHYVDDNVLRTVFSGREIERTSA